MGIQTIILNSTNVVSDGTNSKLAYKFNQPVSFKDTQQIALSAITTYYSWFNITSRFNNNSFAYTWFDSSGNLTNTITINIPDGYYTIETLNYFLQSKFDENGHYLKDTNTGDKKYYIQLRSNSTYYSFQIDCLLMETALPSGFTKGSDTWNLPSITKTPILKILSTNTFNTIIGLDAGDYPPTTQSSAYSKLTKTPQISPITSILCRCNLVKGSSVSNDSDVIFTFTQGTSAFGDLISPNISTPNFLDITSGMYSKIEITLTDQNYNQLYMKDSSTLIMLLIKDK